jgi:hypothetical protein
MVVKLTYHPSAKREKWVVNAPGSGMNPRVFTNRSRALAMVNRLTP